MLLGDKECSEELGFFLKFGKYPPIIKRCERRTIIDNNFDFDVLNYLECNFETYFSNAYKRIKGYY